ncbi:hypothetical protein KFK09_009314 [Dendrobium nobile]|uniref:Uncharacterized protein n=1 Tax=Dendrobium nobile TaxID=94219 RepID=A0A8T3BNF7_DENNO|nr:hypothetical protein KFK09_009314 [Dendrobium nobile]
MSSANEVCLYPFLLPSSTLVVAAALPLVLLLFVVAALFSPGSLAWSQSSCRSSISGPGGLTAAIALAGSAALSLPSPVTTLPPSSWSSP